MCFAFFVKMDLLAAMDPAAAIVQYVDVATRIIVRFHKSSESALPVVFKDIRAIKEPLDVDAFNRTKGNVDALPTLTQESLIPLLCSTDTKT
jgi:hypothetical protein